MGNKKKDRTSDREIRNAKVHHNFLVHETVEAGIKLVGTEGKSVRHGKAQINEAFVRIEQGKPMLYNAHIAEYDFGNLNNHKPTRPRLLLLHTKEIHRIEGAMEAGGFAAVPTRMYLKHGLVKCEIALCKGKKLFDKREDLKKKVQLREAERAIRDRSV